MTTRDPASQLAKEIAELRREVRSSSRGSQMNRRSLEGGSIPVYDNEGKRRGSIGQLPDGTTGFETVNGPKPPTPSAPILEPIVGGLGVTWDGTFEDAAASPGDFRRVEVHAAPQGVYTPTGATHRASLIAPGTVNLRLPADPYTVMFVVVTTANVASDPSLAATETPEPAPSAAEVDAARTDAANAIAAAEAAETTANAAETKALEAAGIAEGKGRVYYGTVAPAADPNGLWIDQTNGANTPKRHDGTSWVAVTDQAAIDAASAAATAQSAADAAAAAAATAQTAAENAQATADSAATNASAALTAANGKNKVFWAPLTAPPEGPFIDNDIWFVTDLGNQPRKRVGTSWVDAKFEDGALASLNVGKLVTGTLAAGQAIIAGNSAGDHTRLDPDGLRVLIEDTVDGVPNEVFKAGEHVGASVNGVQTWSIPSNGDASFRGLSTATDPIINGVPLSKKIADEGSGRLVGYGSVSYPAYGGIGLGELGIIEVNVNVRSDRNYLLVMHGLNIAGETSDSTHADVVLRWRHSTGDPPTYNSTLLSGPHYSAIPQANRFFHHDWTTFASFPSTGLHRLLLTVAHGAGGAGTLEVVACTPTVMIYDMGPHVVSTGVINYGGAPDPNAPAPPPALQRYDEWHDALWSATYNGNGNYLTGPDAYQGYTPYYDGAGNQRSLVGFPDMTGRLAGVPNERIELIEISAYANHWHYNNGGTAVIGYHGHSGQPEVFSGTPQQIYVSGWGRGQRRNIDVTGWRAAMREGTIRGFTLGPGPDNNVEYYGRFNGAGMAEPPKLHIVYYK